MVAAARIKVGWYITWGDAVAAATALDIGAPVWTGDSERLTPDACWSAAYGLGGFPGDPHTVEALPGWYEPHIEAWAEHADPAATLWFWNTEVGWATVHPVLERHGWEYVQTVVWDKGVAHVAGNVNSGTG